LRVAEDLSVRRRASDELLTLAGRRRQIGLVPTRSNCQPPTNSPPSAGSSPTTKSPQPFAQLGREVYRLARRRAAVRIRRWRASPGRKVATGSLVGLESRGWRKDALTTESGRFAEAIRVLEDGARVRLPFTPGAWIGDVKSEPVQALEALELEGAASWGELDPVQASEILREVARLAVLA
jgi:hypothetical protein